MSSVAENIIQHATHNSTLHQLAKDQPSVGVTTASLKILFQIKINYHLSTSFHGTSILSCTV